MNNDKNDSNNYAAHPDGLPKLWDCLHPDDHAVLRFAAAMIKKMAASREKGRYGWNDESICSTERLQSMLLDHLAKGDPVDIGNFAMMLWTRNAPVVDTHPAESVAPIPMILHCPQCHEQHIDEPEAEVRGGDLCMDWDNPPHRSHLCHGCGHIWRPADVPTEGVRAIQTKGSKDSETAVGGALVAMPELMDFAEKRLGLDLHGQTFADLVGLFHAPASQPSPAPGDKDAERVQPVPGLPYADLASAVKKFQAAQESAPSSDFISECIEAMNRCYPVPVTPHTSVVTRAMEARAAFRNGWVERSRAALVRLATAGTELTTEVIGCFDAAATEGLAEVLANTTDSRLKDLVERRLMHALYAAERATAGNAAPGDLPFNPNQ